MSELLEQAPPASFGDGWMTESAQKLCGVAIVVGDFRITELLLAIHEVHKDDGLANVATVTNALLNLYEARREEIAEPGDAETIAYYRNFVKERDALGA